MAAWSLTEELASTPGIDQAVSYWTLGSPPPLRGSDGGQALVLARIGGDEDTVQDRIEELSPAFTRESEVVSVRVGGIAQVFRQVGDTIRSDLAKAESLALPLTILLLVLVFGGVVAASLPVAIGVLAVIETFFVLRVLAEVTQVSVYALNLTTFMGLGLAIDYSLFVVSRYREELRAGRSTERAVVRAVETAGQTAGHRRLRGGAPGPARLHGHRHPRRHHAILMLCVAFGLSMDYEVFCSPASRRSTTSPATTRGRWPSGSSERDGSSPRRRPGVAPDAT